MALLCIHTGKFSVTESLTKFTEFYGEMIINRFSFAR